MKTLKVIVVLLTWIVTIGDIVTTMGPSVFGYYPDELNPAYHLFGPFGFIIYYSLVNFGVLTVIMLVDAKFNSGVFLANIPLLLLHAYCMIHNLNVIMRMFPYGCNLL